MQATSVADPRPFRTILVVAVSALLLLVAVAGLRSYRDLEAARGRERELAAKIEATRAEITALRQRLRRLEEDPVLLECLAREELWMARPDDVVIVLPAEAAAMPPAPPAPDRP
jgi:cell division protein FtsB